MKQLTIEDAKQIELEILDYIDTLCKKHNINYIINYGTLIWGSSTSGLYSLGRRYRSVHASRRLPTIYKHFSKGKKQI